jgi:hypothetical protein
MSTKSTSMSTKITSMSTSMNINMETIVKGINTKMKNTIIHLKKNHTIMIMIMETKRVNKASNLKGKNFLSPVLNL